MRSKFKLLAATFVTTLSLVGVTTVSAFADDGGQGGGYWNNWGNGGWQNQPGWLNNLPPLPGQPSGQNSATVTLSAGWNLVDQGVLEALLSQGVQTYSDYWNGQSYQSTAESKADGIWVYLQSGTTVTINAPSSLSHTVTISATAWGMIGNPYGVPISIALQTGDVAYTYDASTGKYSQASTGSVTLQPGQGAWLYSASGGSYAVGIQPPAPPNGSVTGSVYGTGSSS